jgi:polysaccharide biosynthesis/export protein
MRRILLTLLFAVLTAPLALAQSSGYLIQPGDMLAITVLEDETLNRETLVLPDGSISVPLAGSVQAAGNSVETVERTIADRLASNFAVRPSVFVSVVTVSEEGLTFPIYVVGEVLEPGVFEVESGTTLLQALALGGGPDRFAATKRIQLRRIDPASGQEKLYIFNYRAVERGGTIQGMISLRPGDVIVVPERRLFE